MSADGDKLAARLKQIRGSARKQAPNVRVLAAFAGNAACGLAALGFAVRADFDRLLEGTRYQAQFGQSRFAFQRGNMFESILRKDDYAVTRELLGVHLGLDAVRARVANLRSPNRTAEAMTYRAGQTRELIRTVVERRPEAPNLIDGAVFETEIGGLAARFEADAVAARADGPIHAGEVKSFPVVDGKADPDKLGAALDQVAIYILLLQGLAASVGGDSSVVSNEALLITPRNVGLTPTLSRQPVVRNMARIRRLLAHVPRTADVVDALPSSISFDPVADRAAEEGRRIDALRVVAEHTGTAYGPNCLATCGNARFCRQEAHRAASPCLVGPVAVRHLPGVESLSRAAELADGSRPSRTEEPAAAPLRRAASLYDRATGRGRSAA